MDLCGGWSATAIPTATGRPLVGPVGALHEFAAAGPGEPRGREGPPHLDSGLFPHNIGSNVNHLYRLFRNYRQTSRFSLRHIAYFRLLYLTGTDCRHPLDYQPGGGVVVVTFTELPGKNPGM